MFFFLLDAPADAAISSCSVSPSTININSATPVTVTFTHNDVLAQRFQLIATGTNHTYSSPQPLADSYIHMNATNQSVWRTSSGNPYASGTYNLTHSVFSSINGSYTNRIRTQDASANILNECFYTITVSAPTPTPTQQPTATPTPTPLRYASASNTILDAQEEQLGEFAGASTSGMAGIIGASLIVLFSSIGIFFVIRKFRAIAKV